MGLDVNLLTEKTPDGHDDWSYEVQIAYTDSTWLWGRGITHNVNKIAMEVDLYMHLWRPDEIGVEQAWQLVEPLRKGLGAMYSNYDKLSLLNPINGWGSLDGLIDFTREYLEMCLEYPDAYVEVCR